MGPVEIYDVPKDQSWKRLFKDVTHLDPQYYLGMLVGVAVLQSFIKLEWAEIVFRIIIAACALLLAYNIVRKKLDSKDVKKVQ